MRVVAGRRGRRVMGSRTWHSVEHPHFVHFGRMKSAVTDAGRALHIVRGAILAILAMGTVGMSIELLLIGHFADASQLIPLVLAACALAVMMWVAVRPGVIALRILQLIMLMYLGAGIIGITLHFNANAEFQREIDPTIGARVLFWKVVEATAPPALAPGVMVQLGLLGLVYTYRHPALADDGFEREGE